MKKVILSTVLLSMLAMTLAPRAHAEETQQHDPVAICAATHLMFGALTEKTPELSQSSKASFQVAKQVFEKNKDSKAFAEEVKFTVNIVKAAFSTKKPEAAIQGLVVANQQSCKVAGLASIEIPEEPAKATKVSTTTKSTSAK